MVGMENQAKQFGQVLRILRINAGLTQEELAARLGYNSSAYISRLEHGLKKPGVDLLFAIAGALQVKAWTIIRMMDEEDDCTQELK
jgi:transcriptional regulator with XRE-family HTH domain